MSQDEVTSLFYSNHLRVNVSVSAYCKNSLRTNDISHTCTPLLDKVHV